MTEKHKETIRRLFDEVWSRGKYERVKAYIAAQMQFHYRGQTFNQTPEDLIRIVQRWRAAFPDLRFEVDAILAEDDLVAARLTHIGTHQGPWRGVEPTGRRIRVEEMMFFRFDAGQIVEVWEVTDEYAEREQLMAGGEEEIG